MEEIKILEILTKKAEKYNVSFCGVELKIKFIDNDRSK